MATHLGKEGTVQVGSNAIAEIRSFSIDESIALKMLNLFVSFSVRPISSGFIISNVPACFNIPSMD